MSNLVDITVPVGQSEGTESVIATWFKAEGDLVQENEPVLEISTDKVNMEVASPNSGRLIEILKTEGSQVEPGEVLGRIDTDVTTAYRVRDIMPPPTVPQADGVEKGAAKTGGSGDLSPAVRKMLKEHGVEASAISGTGKGGRITADDVLNYVNARKPGHRDTGKSDIKSHNVPHNQMRRFIAQHMVQSVAAAPHVTSVFDADLSAIVAHREANKADFESRGARLTYTAYFVKAAVDAIREVPEVNSRWHDEALEVYDDINIGIATALENGGLIVPVIPGVQDLDLFEIAQKLGDITERARTEKLDTRDVQNGTFTISNHGVSGSLFAAPIIINQPQSAILGVGKLERRVVPSQDSGSDVEVKPMCYVTLTIDHRVLDGYQANRFLAAWVKSVQSF